MSNVPAYLLATQTITLKRQSDVCANNVANGKTEGFRGDHVSVTAFNTHLKNGETISYATEGPITPNISQGSLKITENAYTVALVGRGFFSLEGNVYARNGILLQNVDGELVNSDGIAFLSTDGGRIAVPVGSKISISRDGVISTPQGIIAQLGVVSFPDETRVQKQGDNLYLTSQDAEPMENPNILQGFLEQSNVQVVKEMIDLTNYSFAYQEDMNMIDQNYKLGDDLVSKLLKI